METPDNDVFDLESATPRSSLLTCAFNQDGGCLAIGTTSGFAVHNLHPQYAISVNHNDLGGVGLVELLFRCNIMLIVGGGPNPHAPPHRVLIWDDHIPKAIGELSFRQSVLCVRLRKDAIAVALRDRCYVYDLGSLTLRDKIYTDDNPHGLLCLSTQIQDMVLACPSVTAGHVRVELYGLRKTMVCVLNLELWLYVMSVLASSHISLTSFWKIVTTCS
jgi:WD repeat-containing protein 45